MHPTPPRLATHLLRRAFRNDSAVEAIVGDLFQDFAGMALALLGVAAAAGAVPAARAARIRGVRALQAE